MDMNTLLEAEKALVLPAFTNDDIWEMGLLARRICAERHYPVTVCIERAGQIVFQCAMPGTSPDNDRWMAGKRAIVRLTHHSSLYNRLKVDSRGGDIEQALKLDHRTYIASGGCVPVFMEGVGFVGSVTVSGMADTEDHALAAEIVTSFAAARKASR